jgi:hypothetical protein
MLFGLFQYFFVGQNSKPYFLRFHESNHDCDQLAGVRPKPFTGQPATESVSCTRARKLAESKRKLPFQLLPIGQKDSSPQNSPNSAEVLMQTGNVFAQKSQEGGR